MFLEFSRRLWIPLELQQGTKRTSRFASGKSNLLSSCEWKHGITLETLQKNWFSSHIEGGIAWFFSSCSGKIVFLSSCNGDLWEPLKLPQGSQASFQVARVTSGFLSRRCRGIGPHFELRQKLRVPLQLQQGSQGSYGVSTGESGLISCCGMKPRFPLEL